MNTQATMRELVMWNRLQALADEQAQALMRTAFAPIVRESGDLSAGVIGFAASARPGKPQQARTVRGHRPAERLRPDIVNVADHSVRRERLVRNDATRECDKQDQ